MSVSAVEPCPSNEAVLGFVYNDEADFFTTVRKTSKLGMYYCGWLTDWVRDILFTPLRWTGQVLRDQLYFPLMNPSESFQWDMNFAAHFSAMLLEDKEPCNTEVFPKLKEVKQAFHISRSSIEVKSGEKTYIFPIYIVESKEKINGRGLRLFLFSFYGNQVCGGKEETNWKPETIYELGAAPVLILKALYERGYQMDSLDLFFYRFCCF